MTMQQPLHAMTRYAAVTERLIHICRTDYEAGRSLDDSAPSLTGQQVAVIVAETLEADGLLDESPDTLMDHARNGTVSDWSLAILAELFFASAEDAGRQQEIFAQSRRDAFTELAWDALENTLNSPSATPALWYEQIYFDVAQQYRLKHDAQAIDLLRRGLAHNLKFNTGNNAINFLRDLAETHLTLDQLEAGLNLYTALLHHDPADIWTYNAMAICFDQFGLAELGAAATQRGLALLRFQGDEHGLQQQLTDSLARMQTCERTGREAEADPATITALHAALTLEFAAGQPLPLAELCHKLVPELAGTPAKTPKTKANLPTTQPPATAPKPGRNKPCWCGSGKKYKQCHGKGAK
jgi:hypothetical protein